jgi:lipid-binding SYLF domain-containing protein
MKTNPWPALLLGALLAMACPNESRAFLFFGPKGDDVAQQKANIRKQSQQMIAQLVAANPQLKEKLKTAAGYATFSQINVNLLLLATSNGYGMVVNNKTGKDTFMRMASLGYGVGAGLRDMRVIFIFNSPSVMQQFVDQGWQFGGQADASAKYQNTGLSAEQSVKAGVDFTDGTVAAGSSTGMSAQANPQEAAATSVATPGGMEVYQLTESGVSLQATVAGTKYWKDSKLNSTQ